MNHQAYFTSKTNLNGRDVSYAKCLRCGKVIFELEVENPFMNMECSNGNDELEKLRSNLESRESSEGVT